MEKKNNGKIIPTKIRGFDSIVGGGLPQGNCILLIAPPMMEIRLFCLEFIYRGIQEKQAGLVVTMDSSPQDLKIKTLPYNWPLVLGEKNKLLRWVDGYSINAQKNVKDTSAIKRIGGPVALSDIGIAISKVQTEFHKTHDYYRFVFDSLSTLLIYNSPESVYRLLQFIIPKLRVTGAIGFFTLSAGMHDQKIEATLRHMTDGAIQIDNNLNIKILSLPIPTTKKDAKMVLGKKGFVVE